MTRSAGSKRAGRRSNRPLWLAALVLAVVAGVLFWYRAPLTGFTQTGASYGARVACACRFVGGRALEDCRKDFESGMELAILSEDADEKSVTVSFPLLASQTATYHEGYGCVLEEWDS
ncbi:hypothetical protein ACXYN8_12580 [Altererythrobacter sp. CAU 1778]